ncbi:hypothetical protein MW887_009310 [Aspergillus wentii]|nr:hypothetical protein MW887_009310 [Aspergillus wentii]
MSLFSQSLSLSVFFIFGFFGQAHAFGAGNIASLSRIEGQNWRHGDIEDALLTLFLARVAGGRKFSKLDVKRVYFGNWLRDYSQAVDVGTLKYVSAEAIRILIWVLGFMSFGYGTREFEVTTDRLGCYEPTEHIDNPLGYAEGEDARDYDHRLRGPVDEENELSVDSRTGLKNYIASEDMGIATSANLVRRVFHRSIQLGRRYARSRSDDDLYEALRLLGTGLHCLEDYAAHSNYTELSLIELGESEVFPHVGRNTKLEVDGAQDYVYPIVTGTFGGVDFFHSVLGELSDKATQSEVQSLEGVINESQAGSPSESFIQDLLSRIPDGIIDDSDSQTNRMDDFKAKADDTKNNGERPSPREPEQWTNYLNNVQAQIFPVLEWHDELIKSINQAIEKIPVLPELIDQIQDQITVFVFSILAPYVLPIIQQVKVELQTGSSEVIQSSREQQHVVFNDDDCSNPTHSMLSKDHFSNILNEPAGRIASQVIKWTVPQLMACWDDEDADIDRALDRIVSGVFHHPALREYGEDGAADIRQIMFGTVEEWWSGKSENEQESLREQLSRDGVLEGKNHKEGVHDSGHGCGKPLALHKGSAHSNQSQQSNISSFGRVATNAAGGGGLGGLVGGLVSGVNSLINNGNSDSKSERPEVGLCEDNRPPAYGYPERNDYQQPQYENQEYGSHGQYSRHEEFGSQEQYGRRQYGNQGYYAREHQYEKQESYGRQQQYDSEAYVADRSSYEGRYGDQSEREHHEICESRQHELGYGYDDDSRYPHQEPRRNYTPHGDIEEHPGSYYEPSSSYRSMERESYGYERREQ